MSIRRLSVWGLPSLFLLIVGAALIVTNLVDKHYGEVAFTLGLLAVGAIALLYAMSDRSMIAESEERNTIRPDSDGVMRNESGRRVDWLPVGVIAGFTGTTILTIGLMFSYELARIVGTNGSSATFFQNWPPGSSGGHVSVMADLSLDPMMKVQ